MLSYTDDDQVCSKCVDDREETEEFWPEFYFDRTSEAPCTWTSWPCHT